MKEILLSLLPWYLLVLNLLAFLAYGLDKRKAMKERWRTPERVLVGLAAWGGPLGALLGMKVFHHKTHKWKFKLLVPLFLLLWCALLLFLYTDLPGRLL